MAKQTNIKKVQETYNETVIVNFNDIKQRNGINFDGSLLDVIDELLLLNNPNYGLGMQMLPAKEIESILQGDFKFFKFDVKEVENETSKRIGNYVAPSGYMKKPVYYDTTTFLEDLQNSGELLIEEDSNIIRWSKTKSKFKFNNESQFYTGDKEYLVGNTPKAIKINITKNDGKNLLKRPIFTMPGISINDNVGQSLVRNIAVGGNIPTFGPYYSKDYSKDNLYKIMDLNYLISLCKIIEMCVQYINAYPDLLYNADCSYYNLEYTIQDFSNLLEIGYLVEHKKFISDKLIHLICECVIAVTHMRDNEILTKQYQTKLKNTYESVFANTRNIADNNAMISNNRFEDNFNIVQIDNMTDIDKFHMIANEFISMKEASNIDKYINKNASIYFKSCQHNPVSLYYPKDNLMVIDINIPSSFIHELAHHIDNTVGLRPLSLDADFRIIAIRYKKALETTLLTERSQEICKSYKRNKSYFHNPTEIFARCLELHLIKNKGMISSLLPMECDLTLQNGYPIVDDDLLNKLNSYFERIITIENSLNTIVSRTEQVLAAHNDIYEEELNIMNSVVEVAATRTILDNIALEHDGDGANYFFKIIDEAIGTMSIDSRPKRRRKKTERVPIEECTQISLL